jgi:expansin (peptidoglycan-binding protein)
LLFRAIAVCYLLSLMSRSLIVGVWAVLAMAGANGPAWGQSLEMGRTAVLAATLPASATWQVERQLAGGSWVETGVLVGGSGSAVSVRMDGWPGDAGYRFRQVAGAGTVLTPVRTFGWHLKGTVPALAPGVGTGPGQLAVEKSANLAAWVPEGLVFARLDGGFVQALEGAMPLGSRGFWRGEVPALPVGDASVTGHTPAPNYEGAAGFGAVYDDMPQIFKDGFIGALSPTEYHRGGQNAAAAGECYELAGPHGRTTVMITDLTEAPAGTVELGRSFFDLGPVPFGVLSGGEPAGGLTAAVRVVPAPVTGNVKFQVIEGSNIYYMALRLYNYRAGVTKLEAKIDGSADWVEMPRTPFNAFVYQAGGSVPPIDDPVEFRVTSRFGEVVSFPPVSGLADGQRVTASGQFAVFPESALAPVPEYRLRPVYVDRFSNVPGEFWSAGGYGGATVLERDTAVFYQGDASVRFTGLGGFGGVTFSLYPGFRRPEQGVLRLAVRAGGAVAAGQVGMTINGRNGTGPAVSSPAVLFPALGTGWQVIEVPLVASGAPETIWGLSLWGNTGGALPQVWWDAVEWVNY